MSRPLVLTIHPKAPPEPDYFRAGYMGWLSDRQLEANSSGAKRFTDAELAAEYWATAANVMFMPIPPETDRLEILHRLATTPSYDQGDH